MPIYDTVANVVSQVAVQCGLGTVADVFASTDGNLVQLRGLLTTVGRRLVLRYPWLQTVKEHTFATTTDTSYTLPSDFQSMVDQTGWNRTEDHRFIPATAQQWQYLKALDSTITIQTVFRPQHLTLDIHSPVSGCTVAFEYRSNLWVALTGSTSPTKNAPTLNTDVIILEAELIKAALKAEFLGDKGFDATKAMADLGMMLDDVQSANVGAAPVLNIGGRQADFLEMPSSPATGLGLGDGGLY